MYTSVKHNKGGSNTEKGQIKETITYSRYVGNHIVSIKSLASGEFKLNV